MVGFYSRCWAVIIFVLAVNINTQAETEVSQLNHAINDFKAKSGGYQFIGLANYYNNFSYFVLTGSTLTKLNDQETLSLDKEATLFVVGRLDILALGGIRADIVITDDVFRVVKLNGNDNLELNILRKEDIKQEDLLPLKYNHLWSPLASLSRFIEACLVWINAWVGYWAASIFIFAILLKFVLLPVSIMTVRFQRKVSEIQSVLDPKLAEIKRNFDGEEAHELIMSAHKDLGVSPFYTLKPMLGTLIQIPFMIAIFNVLGEMSQLDGARFFWISSLAVPDVVMPLPFTLPMLGSDLHMMPFLMALASIGATMLFSNSLLSDEQVKKQRKKLFIMSIVFLFLFYPFPAAMVLYWTIANVVQAVQQKFLRV